jgi:putative methyltransferase (TIGR04325 family)
MRVEHVRFAASVIRGFSRVPGGQSLLNAAESSAFGRSTLTKILAYQRPFHSLDEAERAIVELGGSGHENPGNADQQLRMSEKARPSDYAAFFYIEKILPTVRRIFDLGGSVGNLFYCYSKYLEGMEEVSWTVMDLPANISRGRILAQQRGASQLTFTESWKSASGADLLIASGCLHYFANTLGPMLAELEEMPPYVLINRAPMTDGVPVATVQDNGFHCTACMIHNREEVIRGLNDVGYLLVDEWQAPELFLDIPGHPEHHISSYTGMFLRRSDVDITWHA